MLSVDCKNRILKRSPSISMLLVSLHDEYIAWVNLSIKCDAIQLYVCVGARLLYYFLSRFRTFHVIRTTNFQNKMKRTIYSSEISRITYAHTSHVNTFPSIYEYACENLKFNAFHASDPNI